VVGTKRSAASTTSAVIVPGQGSRNDKCATRAPELPGLGVEPEIEQLGDPVAVYE
tara:strand:- start:1993 stop:2157 length:165 start_codon:yes stop_codon:yes gene_type:complete